MGNSLSRSNSQASSSSAAKARSRAIDKQLEQDGKQFKRECKILLLGSGESGKTTIVKQMKIIHQNGFTQDELEAYKPIIYRNLIDSAQALVRAMDTFHIQCTHPENTAHAKAIAAYELPVPDSCLIAMPEPLSSSSRSAMIQLPPQMARAIHHVWQDPAIERVLEQRSQYYLMDNATHFLKSALRIGSSDYVPDETDVLRARAKSTSVVETRFHMGGATIHMFDVGGQRSERKKWIHCFESVTSIIFCVALSEYDQVLLEDMKQNRLVESLQLFESIVNSRWFLRTSIVLFMNKIDVFKKKLPKVPLNVYFPEYKGGSDINKAAKYIYWRFMQVNRAKLTVFPHLTQATDTANVRIVFTAVKESIFKNALRDSGIL
ncbi:guanine nucleotide-binding protein alpha-3 subunit [Punctularia strigosozonata HHB-11173 SS5]|uniref:guanine nucleotide-binding protein alpha-3 subunit n=1 Tax=Punctularia strigosozonata (strain HHB-11173) TaxID=741275 RepID=UPI0004417055|nr:guanine nucleotide-binding protein alpha-3 subunit [Punctularia strigosozonata HHB-11173 SS5]EIN14744.1 guanine nucleotide-binding protein alpha-3 subunit [Punctularia strigosozonata HHB-11173 SS5]